MKLKEMIGKKVWDIGDDKPKKTNLIIILAAAAVLLILFSDCSLSSCAEDKKSAASDDAYAVELEEKLTDIISSIDGAGETRVMVTLQNTKEYVYASSAKSRVDTSESVDAGGRQSSDASEDTEQGYIIIDTDSGEQALIRTELMPTVEGVVIVCEGAGSAEVAARIEAVVTTALNISSRRVCITQLTK